MSIQTNRLKIKFDIDAIKDDFVFIRLKRDQKKWYGAPQLDQLFGEEYQAHAVMFMYGPYAYAMFKKPVDTYKLLDLIRSDESFADDAVMQVEPLSHVNVDVACICEAWLAQILLNSLASSRSRFKQRHFCNLTGSLLLVPDFNGRNGDFIDAAKVTIDKNYLLNVQLVRHRKLISALADVNSGRIKYNAIKNKPKYVIYDGTNVLRRWLPQEGKPDSKKTYIPLGLDGQKAHCEFLDFSSLPAFNKSRAGIYHQVLENIEDNLSSYMSVELAQLEMPHTVELKETILKSPDKLGAKLDGKNIRIIDKVNSDESYELAQSLKNELLNYVTDEKKISSGKSDKKEALNIRIIHDKEYYETNGEKDEYLPSTSEFQRQHITVESIKSITKPIAKTTIKEILIKNDIGEGKLTLFDWTKLGAKHKWTFATYDGKNPILFMTIFTDGSFEFKELDGNNILDFTEYQEYVELITQAKNDEWKVNSELEGLIISENGDKNLIFKTDEITIPDLANIKRIVEEVDAKLPDRIRTGKELGFIVEQCFAGIDESEDKKVRPLIDELYKIDQNEILKNNFRLLCNDHFRPNSKLGKRLRDYLFDQYGVRLNFSKSKENRGTLFDASLNVNYFGETDSEAYYFVGKRLDSLKSSLDSCHLRKIVADKGSKLVFKEILKTMDVDFVRTGQSTVLPFPFKYLREYEKFKVEKNS
ncbi:MAG: hypothetical protein AWU59_1652 [Methanolobus sp. T82-4]|nr:MAG: hypothetical protein AWU59_1652 [Methanolobus sp. T82-4]